MYYLCVKNASCALPLFRPRTSHQKVRPGSFQMKEVKRLSKALKYLPVTMQTNREIQNKTQIYF